MKRSSESPTPPPDDRRQDASRRVVLLGASNLTMGIGPVLELTHRAWGRPLEVLAALGHGRSYGRASRVFGRQLPGILECGLWRQLALRADVPTAALVTDIGNDILYEEPVARIADWVEQCFDRLAAAGARTMVTLLPVDNLRTLSPLRFRFMRTILVPRCRLSLAETGRRAQEVNRRVRRLATERGFGIVPLRPEWYGFDPIHIRFRHRRPAWTEMLAGWSDGGDSTPPARVSSVRTLYLRSRLPERRRLWGFEQRGRQPAARFADGTTVALY